MNNRPAYNSCSSWLRIFFAFSFLQSVALGFLPSTPNSHSNQAATTNYVTSLSAGSTNPAAGELTNQLARLDRQWRIQQRQQQDSVFSRWTKLVLNPGRQEFRPGFAPDRRDDEYVYLLEPPYRSVPSCVILFTGGAGLGTYPQVAYNEFLLRLSNQLNAAVITAPYPVGLDHAQLAQKNGDLLERAVKYCRNDRSRQYPSNLPTFSLAHSLGSKLSCLHTIAQPEQQQRLNIQAHGYISFNNFGFDQTFTMAKQVGNTFRLHTGLSRNKEHEMLVDGFFSLAERIVQVAAVEFRPSPAQTLSQLRHRLTAPQREKIRLFTFDSDTMDSARDFVSVCEDATGASRVVPRVSSLPGTHLTPVYFQLLPEGATAQAQLGKEDDLQALVEEVCGWVHGREPTDEPVWAARAPSRTLQAATAAAR